MGKPQKGKTIAVVRNGRRGGSKEVKMMLRELGLGERHSLVFMQNAEEVRDKLNTIKPFAFWGCPSFKVVFNLVHKQAMFRDPAEPKERKMLSDNVLIEKHL